MIKLKSYCSPKFSCDNPLTLHRLTWQICARGRNLKLKQEMNHDPLSIVI